MHCLAGSYVCGRVLELVPVCFSVYDRMLKSGSGYHSCIVRLNSDK